MESSLFSIGKAADICGFLAAVCYHDENQFVTEILLPFANEETVIETQNW